VVSDLATLRGPVTPLQVLAGMAPGFVAGGVAGRLARSRWAMLIAPLAVVVAPGWSAHDRPAASSAS